MAANLTREELRDRLRHPETIEADVFVILRSISALLNEAGTNSVGRDMLLRALEWRERFGKASSVLDAMVRASGLFPYVDQEQLTLRDSIAYEFHRPDNLGDDIVFHREQAEIYRRLMAGESIILSAPTSFGKSRIIDAVIASGKFDNIVVVVPTLALIDETRRRLSEIAGGYKVITQLSQPPSTRNVFVLTAERVVEYKDMPKIEFFVIDEFYKMGALKEDESRTIALNEAFYRLLKWRGQFYLLGPNIQKIPAGLEDAYRCYFYSTSFSTVAVDTVIAPGLGDNLERLMSVLEDLTDPTLIYCRSPARVNEVARAMLERGIVAPHQSMRPASDWVAENFHADWVYGAGLAQGVGIHHGRLPRSLAQFVVRAFNEERLRYLVCTSTLIEGVNTKAKNVLIWDNKIARRPLDVFTFNNIRGRSGRMFQHFVGRVYLFDEPPQGELPFVDFPVFTQEDEAPDGLLIQLDHKDLSEKSKVRMGKYADQDILSMDTLRRNRSVDPAAQLELARAILRNPVRMSRMLAWSGFYKRYDQLKFVCELIWKYLVTASRKQGVYSGSQLALKVSQLYGNESTAERIERELVPSNWAADSADEAVERVLQFERTWAGFEFPRLLSALSAIQAEVLSRIGLPFGDYSVFASQVESLFRPPVLVALDEYGIPMQVAEKIHHMLGTTDDLDVALAAIRNVDWESVELTEFERELMKDSSVAI